MKNLESALKKIREIADQDGVRWSINEEWADSKGNRATEVHMRAGDCNCSHSKPFDPLDGHGATFLEVLGKEGDTIADVILAAIEEWENIKTYKLKRFATVTLWRGFGEERCKGCYSTVTEHGCVEMCK